MDKLENLTLFNDDCFNIFPNVEDNTVNLFLLDLPYNQTGCDWDKNIIDLNEMWKHIKRIMKPDGIIIFFCTAKFGFKIIGSNPKWFRYDLIWKKSRKVGFLSANKQPLRQHENIYLFSNNHITHCKNGKYGTYNPQKTEGKPYKVKGGKSKKVNGSLSRGHEVYTKDYENEGDRHPTSIIDHENIYVFKEKNGTYNPQKTEGHKKYISKERMEKQGQIYNKGLPLLRTPTKDTDKRHPTSLIDYDGDSILIYNNPNKPIHKTQKPAELCEWLIKTYSNEGDTVMDFTMGSGTVAIACLNTNRKFIGIEKDEEIFISAQNRIIEHLEI
jgi:DNA modification methylase